MSAVRTPLPYEATTEDYPAIIFGADGKCVAIFDDLSNVYAWPELSTREENIRFIVRACNNHDALVKALKTIAHDASISLMDVPLIARAALTAAGAA